MARVTNVLLVRWSQGWLEVVDAASVTAHGRHGAFLSAGQANTVEEATRLARAILARDANERDDMDITVEPTGVGDVPYDDYVVGDTVTAPDHTGAGLARRVVRLGVSHDEEGFAVYRPTFEAPE